MMMPGAGWHPGMAQAWGQGGGPRPPPGVPPPPPPPGGPPHGFAGPLPSGKGDLLSMSYEEYLEAFDRAKNGPKEDEDDEEKSASEREEGACMEGRRTLMRYSFCAQLISVRALAIAQTLHPPQMLLRQLECR